MKEESRFSEQIASIQARLDAAVKPLLCEAAASREAIASLLDETLSFYEYIASLSILRVAHVPPPGEGEGESEEKEPAFSPGAPSAEGPPPPVNVAVAVHLSSIPAVLSEVERCVTEMIEKIPPVQADLAALVSMPASPVAGDRTAPEGGAFPLLPGKSEISAELRKVSPERMLRDLPATLLTGIAAEEALTGPLFAPPPVHPHLHAGTAPKEPGETGELPARPPLTISPLMLLREIMSPGQGETTLPSIPRFPDGITRPADGIAPPGYSTLWPKTSRRQTDRVIQTIDGESPDTKLAPVYREAVARESRSVVQIPPLHILSSLMGRPGEPTQPGTPRLPLTFSPSLPVRLLSQSVPVGDAGSGGPVLDPWLSPAAAPLRTDIPVAAVEKKGREALITPLTPALPVAFLKEFSLRQEEPTAATGGQRDVIPSRAIHPVTTSPSPRGGETRTTAPPQGTALDLTGRSMPKAQAEMARNLLNPVLIPSTLPLTTFSSLVTQGAGGEIGPVSRSPLSPAFPQEVVNTLLASEGGEYGYAGGGSLRVSASGQRSTSSREGGVTALSAFSLPSLPLRLLTSTAPFTARRGESALKESLSRVHPARFILSLLTGHGEGLGGAAEPPLFPAAGASQAMLGISAAYGPVLPHAGLYPPQEGIEGGYPGLTQLQQMISVYSGAGGQVQAGAPFAGGLQPAPAIANVFQPPAPPVKVTPPDIRKAAEATARQASMAGDRPVTFHNNFEITVQVKGGGIDGDMHELGRKIGSILADEMRRHGGI